VQTTEGLAFSSVTLGRSVEADTAETGVCCLVKYSPNGTVSARNVGLGNLIASAYGVYKWQIVGAPEWTASVHLEEGGDRFDLQAAAPRGTSRDDMQRMLQTMLAEKFGLTVHRETRSGRTYELVVEPGGHKLAPAGAKEYNVEGDVWLKVDPSTITATLRVERMTMTQLARNLGGILLAPVVDRTGLTLPYAVTAQWKALDPNPDPSTTIFAAFPTQLGLRLSESTGPVEYLVVDRAVRPTLIR
jgi:uncharacterized protein (TIGR03435 family)